MGSFPETETAPKHVENCSVFESVDKILLSSEFLVLLC